MLCLLLTSCTVLFRAVLCCAQMAEYSINAKITGILQDTHFLDKWQDHPDVLYARPLVQVRAGTFMLCFAAGMASLVCKHAARSRQQVFNRGDICGTTKIAAGKGSQHVAKLVACTELDDGACGVQPAYYVALTKPLPLLESGTLFAVSWMLKHPACLVLLLLLLLHAQAGSKCVCVADGLPTWVCELMVVKPTVQEAIAFVKQIEESLTIPIVPLAQ